MNSGNRGAVRLLAAAIAGVLASRAFEGEGAVPATVKDLSGVPEALHSFYEQIGDEFVLKTDDSRYKSKITEFRNNNVELLKAKEALEKKLQGVGDLDPNKYREMQKKLQEMEDQSLIDEGKIEELLTNRTERMRKDFESQTSTLAQTTEQLKAERDGYKAKLETVLIDSQVSQAVGAVGTVRKGALPDVLARARQTWKLDDDGNPVALNSDGSKRYGKDGTKPLTIDEWSKELLLDAPFLFEGSGGGGSDNRDGGRQSVPAGQVHKSDRRNISNNLEEIASGKIRVVQ